MLKAKNVILGVACSEIVLVSTIAYARWQHFHSSWVTLVQVYHWIPSFIMYAASLHLDIHWRSFSAIIFSLIFLASIQTAIVSALILALQRVYSALRHRYS